MWNNLKKLFSGEKLYTETEVRKCMAIAATGVATKIKTFNAGAVDVPLDKFVDTAVEEYLKTGV